jgi:hypothetical protein
MHVAQALQSLQIAIVPRQDFMNAISQRLEEGEAAPACNLTRADACTQHIENKH